MSVEAPSSLRDSHGVFARLVGPHATQRWAFHLSVFPLLVLSKFRWPAKVAPTAFCSSAGLSV
jgi:hypothetical protein